MEVIKLNDKCLRHHSPAKGWIVGSGQDTVEVNGPGADPLYKWLKATAPTSIPGSAFTRTSDLLWNYEKFLCNLDGVPVKRFKSPFNPADFEDDVRPASPPSSSAPCTRLPCPPWALVQFTDHQAVASC